MTHNNQKTQFKQTEIGEIPTEWTIKAMKSVAEVNSGGSAPQDEKYFKGKFPFVRVSHLQNDSYKIDNFDLITKEAVKACSLKLFPKGTIVFPKSGASVYLEKRAMLPQDSYIVSHLCGIDVRDKSISQNYLFYHLIWRKLSKEKSSNYPTLNLSFIRNFPIILPHPPEQKKIAYVLTSIQDAIQKQKEIIEKTKELKKSLMHKLFTEGIRNEPQKQTEIGPVPKSWEVKQLEHLAKIILGQSPPSETYNKSENGLPFLQGSAEFKDIHPENKKWCSKPKRKVREGDLLISVRAPVGDLNIADQNYCIGRGLSGVMAKDQTHGLFLYYFLQFSVDRIKSLASGSTFKSITKSTLLSFKVPLPTMAEQEEIADILGKIENKIQIMKSKKQKLEELFKSLLHHLMRGEIRVNNLEFEV